MAVILCGGCQKVIEPEDLPEQDPKLVLNSVLYTGEPPTLSLSSSKSILSGKPFKVIANAECDLYENDSWVERLKYDSMGYYSGKHLPVADRKYTFRVNAAGYPGIEASTVMPSTVTKARAERYDTTAYDYTVGMWTPGIMNFGGMSTYKIWISDDATKKNVYALDAVVAVYDSLGNKLDLEINSSVSRPEVYSLYGGYEVTDEVLVNGSEVFVDVRVSFESGGPVDVAPYSAEVFLRVANISEEITNYRQTVYEQASMGSNFFAEPVLVYNNVKNGMGLLGSANNSGLFLLFKGKLKKV